MSRPALEVADIFRDHGTAWRRDFSCLRFCIRIWWWKFLSMIHPFHVTGFNAYDRQARAALIVANFVSRRNVFGVRRFGHEIRNNRVLGASTRFHYACDYILLIRSQRQRTDALRALQVERFPRILTLALGFLFFALGRMLADHFKQILLFLLHELLAVCSLLLFGSSRPVLRTCSATLSLSLSDARTPCTGSLRASSGRGGRPNVRDFYQRSVFQ